MEGFAEGDDLFPAGVEGGELEGVLICLGSGIAEEQLVIGAAADLSQFVGELLLQRDADGIAVKTYFAELIGDALYIMRVCMTDRNDGMAAIEIEVLLAVLVPDVRTFGFDYGDFIYRVNIK